MEKINDKHQNIKYCILDYLGGLFLWFQFQGTHFKMSIPSEKIKLSSNTCEKSWG